MDGKQYEVIGQVMRGARDETVDLRNLYVTTEGQPPVLLDKLVRVEETSSPPQIFRFDRYESATVSAALAPGKTIGDGIEAMEGIASRSWTRPSRRLSPVSRGTSSRAPPASSSCSCWRWCWSTWSWPPSSRASGIR